MFGSRIDPTTEANRNHGGDRQVFRRVEKVERKGAKPSETAEGYDHLRRRSISSTDGYADQVFFNATDSTMLATSSHASVVISIVS